MSEHGKVFSSADQGPLKSSKLLVRNAQKEDLADIARVHARVFGPGRFARSAYRVREGTGKLSDFCHVGFLDKRLVAALSFTEVTIGGTKGALLLGPFVVDPQAGQKGLGASIMQQTLLMTRNSGIPLVVLVGDYSYYKRFGFKLVPAGQITFPGPVDPERILALENVEGSLDTFQGRLQAT